MGRFWLHELHKPENSLPSSSIFCSVTFWHRSQKSLKANPSTSFPICATLLAAVLNLTWIKMVPKTASYPSKGQYDMCPDQFESQKMKENWESGAL
jgi:hypothetical protein